MFSQRKEMYSASKDASALNLVEFFVDELDAIVMARFDVLYSRNISSWNLDWTKIYLAFRDVEDLGVSDLIHIFPTSLFALVMKTFESLGGTANDAHDFLGTLHRNGLTCDIVSFIDPARRVSTVHVNDPFPSFLYICRSCLELL
jgi:hypothetical protein